MKGIDISYAQPKFSVLEFKSMINQGYEFCIVKIGEDYEEDENFRHNFFNAQKAGMKMGIYIYSYATDIDRATNEINWLIAKIKEIGLTNWHTPMGIWIDWEDREQIHASHDVNKDDLILSNQEITDIMFSMYKQLKDYGWDKVGIYCGYNILWNYTFMYSQHPEIPIYCSQFNTVCDYPNAEIWQYTDQEYINGFNIDKNVTL